MNWETVDTNEEAVVGEDKAADTDAEHQTNEGEGAYHWSGQEDESEKTQALHPMERLRRRAPWAVRW